MIPKHPPRNLKAIKKLREEHDCCERCGSHLYLEVAHIISRGAGGPDIEENMLMLCGPASLGMGCHGADHKGKIPKKELFEIAGNRIGITGEECRKRTRKAMGYNVG